MTSISRRLFLGAAAALGFSGTVGGSQQATRQNLRRATSREDQHSSRRFQQGYQVSPRKFTDNDKYNIAPVLIKLKNDNIILFYHEGPAGCHACNDMHVRAQLSTDFGETWSDPIIVADHEEYYTGNISVIYDDEKERLTVHYRRYNSGEQIGEFYRTSEDHGRSWSDPREIHLDHIGGIAAPFGDYVRTSNGLMTTWYGFDGDGNFGVVEALFSTDGGQTWGNNTLVGDSTDDPSRVLTEPVPVALSEDELWVFGRDNETADMFIIQSEDGGDTWSQPVYTSLGDMVIGTPFWAERTNANEVTISWGDRTNGFLNVINTSARLAWQDPTLLAEEPIRRLALQIGENAIDFGYPTLTTLGRDRRHTLVAFYDEDNTPDIWLMSLYNT